MRNLLLPLIAFLTLPLFGMSQDWEMVSKEGDIVIEQRTEQCTNDYGTVYEYVFLRFTNFSSTEVHLNFQLPVWLDGVRKPNLADGETEKSITIPASGSVEGDCSGKLGTLRLYSKLISMEGGSEMTSFAIESITLH